DGCKSLRRIKLSRLRCFSSQGGALIDERQNDLMRNGPGRGHKSGAQDGPHPALRAPLSIKGGWRGASCERRISLRAQAPLRALLAGRGVPEGRGEAHWC